MKFRSWALGALSVSMLIAAGCGDDDDASPMTPDAGTGYMRVAHLSPDAPAVDVKVDGQTVLSGVDYEQVSSYLTLSAGTHRVQVLPAGGTNPVIDAMVNVVREQYATVAATGKVSDIGATVLVDDRTTSTTQARLRFVHAGADAPAVDVTLTDGTVLFDDVAFEEATSYLATPGSTYDLQVRAAGTNTVVLSFDDVPVIDGSTYTIFATGLLSDNSLRALVAVDAPGNGSQTVGLEPATSFVRVAHLSPDAPEVDVYLDGALVGALTNVPFRAVSGYLEVSAATHTVQVFASGTTINPVIDAALTLLPGTSYTVAATGLLEDSDLSPIVLVDDRVGQNGQARVRFVHTSPDAPAVDVAVTDGPTLFSDVLFRSAAGYGTVAPGTYDLEVRLAEGGAVALAVPDVQLAGGTNYTVFAVGLVSDSSLGALLVSDTR